MSLTRDIGRLNIDSDGSLHNTRHVGSVGIGTTSPDRNLHVKKTDTGGTVAKFENSAGSTFIELASSAGGGANGGYIEYNATKDFKFAPGDTNRMTIKADGKVGIGTDNPSVDLEVSNSGNSFALVKNTSSGSGLYIKADTDGDTELQTAGGNNNIVIRTAGSERARITSSGHVGIGQASPDAELHISATRPHIDVEDTAAGTRAKFGAGYANTYIATTSSGGEIFFKNGVGGSDFPHSSGTNLAIIGANGSLKTYGNTFHIHAGQGTLSHANEFQFLTTEVATGTSGNWYDVCYVSHSPNLRFHGLTVQDNNASLGGARYIGALMGTYGNVARYQEQKRVSAMNGGGISDIDYRYLNSGASSGSYRLQVKVNFSGGAHRAYTCVYGNAVAELQKDGY